MKRKPIKYRHSYLFNPVTLGLIALIIALGATLWSAAPSMLVRIESNRIIKSTAEKFGRERLRYLEDEAALDELYTSMRRALHGAQITDPDMEAWIEIDEQGQAHLGVIYDLATEWPLGIAKPLVMTVRQEHTARRQ